MSGTLSLTLSEPKRYRCIFIGLYGQAEVKWHHSVVQRRVFLGQVVTLWNSSESVHGMIGPGTYSLPFHLSLPSTCPDSFSSSQGSVKYYLQGCIIAESLLRVASHNHTTVLPLGVMRISVITNLSPHLLVPLQYSKSKVVGVLMWRGSVEFTVSLIRSYFCVGQKLPLVIDVTNSHPSCIRMRISIKRYRTYCFARPVAQQEKQVVATETSGEINPHSTHSWVIEDFYVPPTAVPSQKSTVVKVEYMLKVSTIVPMARKVAVKIPLTVGNTVPLTQ